MGSPEPCAVPTEGFTVGRLSNRPGVAIAFSYIDKEDEPAVTTEFYSMPIEGAKRLIVQLCLLIEEQTN
jgi:hypothetical protein